MTGDVGTTISETLLSEAAAVMGERKIGCLPVVDGGKPVGIVTEGNFVAAASENG